MRSGDVVWRHREAITNAVIHRDYGLKNRKTCFCVAALWGTLGEMASTKRHDGRKADELRAVRITTPFVGSADGSCLIEMGRTRVICTACFVPGVPEWRKGSGKGWMTAEYGMLPASTRTRKARPLAKPDGRGVEIQRLIGRVLRMVLRLDKLGENTVHLDCDVLEADGGTRTAAITGSYVALAQAVGEAARRGACAATALSGRVATVSEIGRAHV